MNLKWQNRIFKILLTTPFLYWMYLIFLSDLGADPAKRMNHKTGEMAYYYLMANLMIGVLIAVKIKLPTYLRFIYQNRRFLGVISFFFLMMHLSFYFAMESFEFKAFEQMYTKLYLILGSTAWIIFFTLAVTSNDFSVRHLGQKKWKWIHRLNYLGFFIASVHILNIEKTDLIKYSLLLLSMLVIQTYRLIKKYRSTN